MRDRKRSTFVYNGFGIPIKLINAPMKKLLGKWVLDIDLNKLQAVVLQILIHKPTLLSGEELKFIRKSLNMTTTEFGKLFGVSHVAVVKWENGDTHTNPPMETCIRLHMLNYLHAEDKEFRNLYNTLGPGQLAKRREDKKRLISINVDEDIRCA